MPILNRDEFFERVQAHVGSDTSEEAIRFLEDMTDTYNDMENRINGDGEDWERRYHELDESWRQRYRHRFYDSSSNNYVPPCGSNDTKETDETDPENISVSDLFE